MSTGDFCEWLAKKYGINLYKLTFRDAVGRYIRVYGKDNHDEKHPLNADSSEAGSKASIAILRKKMKAVSQKLKVSSLGL